MSASLQIVFLDSASLGESRSLEYLLEVFGALGFEFNEFQVGDQVLGRKTYLEKPDQILNLAYAAKQLSFQAFNNQWRLEVRQQIAWGALNLGREKRAWVRTSTDNTPYFWHSEYDVGKYSRFFLDIGKQLYGVLGPTFGWIDFNHGLFTTHEDIETLRTPALYWSNFFGPRYVAKLGRKHLLAAPAWSVEELLDGGILYVLASSPGLADDHVSPEQVKAHFGVAKVR